MFHSVLLEPAAYASYRRSGRFAGELVAVELAVKDSARFAGRWAYFDFGRRTAGA
ncbi:MAG: hypothetical protein H0W29_08455, partial [Gemmatimonadales bacterium]|nr:hypothetical protein [Gemmatimonadales bacterium]